VRKNNPSAPICKAECCLFDLENPRDLAKLENPLLALEQTKGLIVIDEIQRRPELFPVLRVLADNPNCQAKYLILGSASRDLIHQSSETLAGRIAYHELTPFSLQEVDHMLTLWLRGGFPLSYLASSEEESYFWRQNYITTFLERDIPALGINIPAMTLRRFWTMLAHYHANIFNSSEIGRSMGLSHTTIRHYLDILVGTFMIRSLQPYEANLKKRQIKSPKIYFRDSGILHGLLDIPFHSALQNYPKLGASWEGFALEETIKALKAQPHECFFWGTHSGAELDLLIIHGGKRLGFEFKYSDAPRLTSSMKTAMELLNLDQLTVIYPGPDHYRLSENINVCSLEYVCTNQGAPDAKS
jgi:predicted AAA+ superfamily ATPase